MAEAATVESVNGYTGTVVLGTDDLDDTTTIHKFVTVDDLAKLAGIEPGATTDLTGAEIIRAIDTELGGGTWQGGALVALVADLGHVGEALTNRLDLGMIA
jgi:hypothetical protein